MGLSNFINIDDDSISDETVLNINKYLYQSSTDAGNDYFSFYGFSTPIRFNSWFFEPFRNSFAGFDDFLNKACSPDSLNSIRSLFRQKYPGYCYDAFIFARKSDSCRTYHIAFEKAENGWVDKMRDELNRGKAIPISLYQTINEEQRIIKIKSDKGDGHDNAWSYFRITSDRMSEIQKHINDCGPGDVSGVRFLCPQDYHHENDSLHLFCRKDKCSINWCISRERVSSGWFVDNLKGLKNGNFTILDTYEDFPGLNLLFILKKV